MSYQAAQTTTWMLPLQQLVSINSHTFNKAGVDQVSDLFTEWLEALGFEAEHYPRQQIGDHVHYRTPDGGGQKLLLLGHADTVFAPGRFETFHADDTWVYGPGVCDMKGGLVVALEALRRISAQGALRDVDFLLVSDEETGSDDSRALTTELASRYHACLVFEAAGANMEVVVGRKGIGTFRIDIKGKAAHAGLRYSEGVNANLEAAHKLIALTALTNISLGTTVNVGKISGGIGANTISPEASLLIEMRYRTPDERDRLLMELDAIVQHATVDGTEATLSGGLQRDVMAPNAAQQQLLATLQHLHGKPLPSESRGGVSDANLVAAAGVATLDGFGPFGDGDHTLDERALKTSFDERIELCARALAYHQQHGRLY